jgi:hypothetical protein
MPRVDGLFKVLEKINENAYKLDLPTNFGVSPTFNIADLKSYLGEEDELELRTTQMQEGDYDVNINISDTSTPTHNLIWTMETCVMFCCLGIVDRKETELHSRR